MVKGELCKDASDVKTDDPVFRVDVDILELCTNSVKFLTV